MYTIVQRRMLKTKDRTHHLPYHDKLLLFNMNGVDNTCSDILMIFPNGSIQSCVDMWGATLSAEMEQIIKYINTTMLTTLDDLEIGAYFKLTNKGFDEFFIKMDYEGQHNVLKLTDHHGLLQKLDNSTFVTICPDLLHLQRK